ncbi:uncharacterized protein (DUF427 family) [Palleronia aestuarii]|uniref:Uncharacterized protein (DUF427 family) n=1 Tax=Palleronia aestuarii TaxID=568105 RepID=A0A2W7Q3N3_9RHOB|nr:DUF427 domain-containing protein [Palleronia aestuarii]PZX16249.1 uncharacterized protein (DUF427 family) [Palleronia aestuarii]
MTADTATTSEITIEDAPGTWVIRAGGSVIGESRAALFLHEDGHSPVLYFPREDIAMAVLDPSETHTTCPLKGEARYFSLETESGHFADIAWSYEDPPETLSRIRGRLAFSSDDVAVEEV